MNFIQRKKAFIQLGEKLKNLSVQETDEIIAKVSISNQWFTPGNVKTALNGIISLLDAGNFEKWLDNYDFTTSGSNTKKVGVIMAGNIPCVGFHDMMCVLLAGHELHAKLSTEDKVFPKIILNYLAEIEPGFANAIFYKDQMKDIEALIATGSDNSARYFEYYFSKIPRIIRRNRTSIAILDGTETKEDLQNLGRDIFTYFGLGCRNVSKIFIPEGYDLKTFYEAMYEYNYVLDSKKYANNYEYNRTIYLMNLEDFFDNNFLIIKESPDLVSPVAVLYYQVYSEIDDVLDYINLQVEKLQCIVSRSPQGSQVRFGQTQVPSVWDYADNVDTMQFLSGI